jgi:hypothetical protein
MYDIMKHNQRTGEFTRVVVGKELQEVAGMCQELNKEDEKVKYYPARYNDD